MTQNPDENIGNESNESRGDTGETIGATGDAQIPNLEKDPEA